MSYLLAPEPVEDPGLTAWCVKHEFEHWWCRHPQAVDLCPTGQCLQRQVVQHTILGGTIDHMRHGLIHTIVLGHSID